MQNTIKGPIWKLGDDIDTDLIYPGKYLPIIVANEMAEHALEGYDPEFPAKIQEGDIIVAGKNFGCGSSREQAATSLKFAGIAAIIAKSYSRIFFRNAVNQGLPLLTSNLVEDIEEAAEITIDFVNGTIAYPDGVKSFPALPPSVMDILNEGGLIPAVRKSLGIV
ncbi:MAG: 3-isopropylmalate dehydratase [candidate division Zixibacteria bacterium]|nr:3-isopropylmalate dehydratase [Candidatus Tariuqbacter arcticus]